MQTIICMKWGNRYGPEYVNNLWSMVKRKTQRETTLICLTDDPADIHSDVKCYALPPLSLPEEFKNRPWRKIALWKKDLQGLRGNILFLDLDIVITGNIDSFFEYKPEATFIVIENWTQIGSQIGNTSVYRFKVGAHPYLYDNFVKDPKSILDMYSNSQTYISLNIKEKAFWPSSWCLSFKEDILPKWPLNFIKTPKLPPPTRIVCFPGKPDPDEARDGKWPAPWYKKFYKYVKPTPWIEEYWHQ